MYIQSRHTSFLHGTRIFNATLKGAVARFNKLRSSHAAENSHEIF